MPDSYSLDDRSILVTGGTGSFGRRFVASVIKRYKPRRLIVFSRDEMKQFEMAQQFPEQDYPMLRYFIGDVRDRNRLMRACARIDVIIHAAAMKHITAAEYNPTECIATNIGGAQNIIDAAIENDVERVIALSTDKAANPINLYGATKLCSDKLFVAANNLSGKHRTRFAVVRYGNVIGSRGSVVPLFKRLIERGEKELPITHPDMTRFLITLDEGVDFVQRSLSLMTGGEIFVPKLPSVRVVDIVPAIDPSVGVRVVGIRPGEKLHEVMIPLEESRNVVDMDDYFVIQPSHHWWNVSTFLERFRERGRVIEEPFEYASDRNDRWLMGDELRRLMAGVATD
jgi:UDP-N-acetylglucosamine 4,6-dehydratase